MAIISHPDPVRLALIERIFRAIESIGEELSPESLEWGIKLGEAFLTHNNLTDKQINVLLNILEKHKNANRDHTYYCERIH